MYSQVSQGYSEHTPNAILPNSSEIYPVPTRVRLFRKLLACPEFQRVVGIQSSSDLAIDESDGVYTCSFADSSLSIVYLGSNQYTARWKVVVKRPNQPTSEFFLKTWPTAAQQPDVCNQWLAQMEQLKARIRLVSESCADALCKVPKILAFNTIKADLTDGYATHWTVLEYIHGQTLEQMFLSSLHEQTPRIAGKQAYQITQAVLEALAKFQELGLLHRDVAPRNIVLGPYGEIFLVDPDLVRSFHEEQGGTHLTPRHEHALAYYGASLLEVNSRPTADGYALGFTILHLLTAEHPDLLRDKVKHRRFWNKLEKNLLVGGLTKRETSTFLQVLRRLTHPDWAHRIQEYTDAVKCLREQRKPGWRSSPIFTRVREVRKSWENRRRKITFEDLNALNFLYHPALTSERYSTEPEFVTERLRIFAQALKEADSFGLPPPADAARDLLSIVKGFHERDQATVLAEFVQVTTLSYSLLEYITELLKQMKSRLFETENLTMYEYNGLVEAAKALVFSAIPAYSSIDHSKFHSFLKVVVDFPWTDVDVLHQVWGLAKNGTITPHLLTEVIDKAFSGHEQKIRGLVRRVVTLPNENQIEPEFFDEIWTCASLGNNKQRNDIEDKAKKLIELLFSHVVTRFEEHQDVELLHDVVTHAIGINGLVSKHVETLARIMQGSRNEHVQLIAATALLECEAGLEKLWTLVALGHLPHALVESLVAKAFTNCNPAIRDNITNLLRSLLMSSKQYDECYKTTLFDPLWETRSLPEKDVVSKLYTLALEHWRLLDGHVLWQTMSNAFRFYNAEFTFPDGIVLILTEIIKTSPHKMTKLLGLRLLAKNQVLSGLDEDDQIDSLIHFAESCGLHDSEILVELAAAGLRGILDQKYIKRVAADKATCETVFQSLSPHFSTVNEWKSALELLGLGSQNAARYFIFNLEIARNFLFQDPVALAQVLLESSPETQFRLLVHIEEGNLIETILRELDDVRQLGSHELPAWLVLFVESLCEPSHAPSAYVSTFLEKIFLCIQEVPSPSIADLARKIGVKCRRVPKNILLAYPRTRDEFSELLIGLERLGIEYRHGRIVSWIRTGEKTHPLSDFAQSVTELILSISGGRESSGENFTEFVSALFSNLDEALNQPFLSFLQYRFEIIIPTRGGARSQEIFFPEALRLFILGDFLQFVESAEKCPCFAILSIGETNARSRVWNSLAQHPRVAFWLLNYYVYRHIICNSEEFAKNGYHALQGYEINPHGDHKFISNMVKALRYGFDLLLELDQRNEYQIVYAYGELLPHFLPLVFNGFSREALLSNITSFLQQNPDQIEELIETLDVAVKVNLRVHRDLLDRVHDYCLAAVGSLIVIKEVDGPVGAQEIQRKFNDLYGTVRDYATRYDLMGNDYISQLLCELDRV